jgi:dipeptidyl aminopeptidase/acylaminoacyl peptidase
MSTAPYGSWVSPITSDLLTTASVGLIAPVLDGADLYWLERHADQGGRVSIWRRGADGRVSELTPSPTYVRSRVHEYGGGAYAVRDGVAVYSDFPDGKLYVLRDGREPEVLADREGLRYADLRVHPERNLVLAVREDHSGPGEAVNAIVALHLDRHNADGGRVLCSGADFYSTPELSPDDRLAWTQWNHPDMPWDSTSVMVGRLDRDLVVDAKEVAGGHGVSAVQPRWTADGALIYVSDRTDWWNLYLWRDGIPQELHRAEAEFCDPQWVFGANPYAVADEDHLVCTWRNGGSATLGLLTISTGALVPLCPEQTVCSAVVATATQAGAVFSYSDRPDVLVLLDLPSGAVTPVRSAGELAVEPGYVSVPRAVSWPSPQGPVHGWFYPPTNPEFTGPSDGAPPLITLSHGGPTGIAYPTFDLEIQFWTSRGLAVLDVNYGGSTGYGRAYRERLKGTWGVVDVEDCAAGARAMSDLGLADPDRLAIMGGSAGGYTTLQALTTTNAFTAGISLYGVGDLEALARDTHKFESRYIDGLVGSHPDRLEVYRDRSPIHHVNDLSAPILLLQGADDMVVPPNQAESMADAARSKGLPVALLVFAGEGHGFRRSENIKAALDAQLYFLGQIFGFTPADQLTPIEIENAPAR